MIWSLRHYGPPGVFVSETVKGLYAECWPGDVLRPLWGNRDTFRGFDLYPYYAYIGEYGSIITIDQTSVYIAFGSLEECMEKAEREMTDGSRRPRLRYSDADRKFTP